MRAVLRVALCVFVLSLAAPQGTAQRTLGPEPTPPLRIMPMGDSITEGDEEGGYRWHLFEMLTESYALPNFVGHRNGRFRDREGIYDSDHDGYSAYRIDEIADGGGEGSFWNAPTVEERLEAWDPRIVLLHAGTNDMQQGYCLRGCRQDGIPDVVERLRSLVERICVASPDIYVLVAQIVPANAPKQRVAPRIEAFNTYLPGMVAGLQAQGYNVRLVDMYTPMLAFPHPDGIHPSLEGNRKMAEVWHAAIMDILPLENFNTGRDDDVRVTELYSTTNTRPWRPTAQSLLRTGSSTLEETTHLGYTHPGSSPALLTDGQAGNATLEDDNAWKSTYVLDTSVHTEGYDIEQIRTAAGDPPTGEAENVQQAYEVWYSTVDAPTRFQQLGDFHHILVNEQSVASALQIDKPGEPLARNVKALRFVFVEPPRRQGGFFGIGLRTRYYEIEALGQPSASARAGAAAGVALPTKLALTTAPNPLVGTATVRFALPESGSVRVVVYDLLGRAVVTLHDGWAEAGQHAFTVDAAMLTGGAYVLRVQTEREARAQRVTVLR